MEPKKDEIKLGLDLLSALANKKPDVDILKKLSPIWTDIVSAGMTLVSGNKRLREAADNLKNFFEKDGGFAVLKAVVAQRKRLQSAAKKVETIYRDWDKAETTADHPGLSELLGLKMPDAWQSEIQSQFFDDAVSFQAAEYYNILGEAMNKLDGALTVHVTSKAKGASAGAKEPDFMAELLKDPEMYADIPSHLAKDGSHYWAQDLDSKGLDAMFARADSTIQRFLPAAAIKEYADFFSQAGQRVRVSDWYVTTGKTHHSIRIFWTDPESCSVEAL